MYLFWGILNKEAKFVYLSNLLFDIMSFKKKTKPNNPENNQTRDSFESLYELFERREKVLNAFKSVIFSVLQIEGTKHLSDLALHLKMLTHKQKLKRLPVLAQVKACNTFENLLNEI